MKKLLILLSIVLSSCTCIMSQGVPAQYLPIDETCGAAMPDYRPLLHFVDNCGIDTIEQTPTPGSWLTMDNPTVTALIRAYDKARNFTDAMFTITLIDDEAPQLIDIDSTLITNVSQQIDALYDKADWMLARHQNWIDYNMLADSIPVNWDHYNDIHITWTSPDKFLFGTGHRVHTWESETDTLIFNR